jgi:hypothetical protein
LVLVVTRQQDGSRVGQPRRANKKNEEKLNPYSIDPNDDANGKASKRTARFRIGELNPGLVGTDHLSTIESDKS